MVKIKNSYSKIVEYSNNIDNIINSLNINIYT